MRITLFGSSGLLGQALADAFQEEQVTALSSRDADLRDSARVQEVVRGSRPDCIILAAAYTDVDGCELNPQLANAVNKELVSPRRARLESMIPTLKCGGNAAVFLREVWQRG